MTATCRSRWIAARHWLALALMLVAVLPHATLAASLRQPAGHVAHAAVADVAEDCHGSRTTDPDAPAAMPPCCILGCGLIATAPEPELTVSPAAWLIRPAAATQDGNDRTTEPAERPPRHCPAQISRHH